MSSAADLRPVAVTACLEMGGHRVDSALGHRAVGEGILDTAAYLPRVVGFEATVALADHQGHRSSLIGGESMAATDAFTASSNR